MMKTLQEHRIESPLLKLFLFTLILVGCSSATKGPLSFHSPAGWQVEHHMPGGLHFYSVTATTPDEGLLMFSQWPPPSRPEEMPDLVKKLADGFLDQVKQSPDITLASYDYHIEKFTGSKCHGSYAIFQADSDGSSGLQAVFMMSVDDRVWNGQFTGSAEAWVEAIVILKSIKKSG